MKHKMISFFLFILSHGIIYSDQCAITHRPNVSGLGSNLKTYIHAKWLAYKYDVPFLLHPFKTLQPFNGRRVGSDGFRFHHLEKHLTETMKKKFSKILPYRGSINRDKAHLYITPSFPEEAIDRPDFNGQQAVFEIDRYDVEFRNELKYLMAPAQEYKQLDLPKDRITLAVHVRRSAGIYQDRPITQSIDLGVQYPAKAPLDSYYIRCIQIVSELLEDVPIYCFLFFDAPEWNYLARKYEELVNKANITFDFRTERVKELDDFFGMTHFDCLIRPSSDFSACLCYIADFKILIHPRAIKLVDGVWQISEVVIKQDGKPSVIRELL